MKFIVDTTIIKYKIYYVRRKKKKRNPVGDIIIDFYVQDELEYVYAKDKHEAVEKFFKKFGFMNVVSKIEQIS